MGPTLALPDKVEVWPQPTPSYQLKHFPKQPRFPWGDGFDGFICLHGSELQLVERATLFLCWGVPIPPLPPRTFQVPLDLGWARQKLPPPGPTPTSRGGRRQPWHCGEGQDKPVGSSASSPMAWAFKTGLADCQAWGGGRD